MENAIILCRMFTGEYTKNNIGHEIINYFKSDNGKNYIYINPLGTARTNLNYDYILLTGPLINKRIEIYAIAKPLNFIYKKYDNNKKQKEYIDENEIRYGGKKLYDIYNENIDKKDTKYITFEVTKLKKPNKRTFLIKNEINENYIDKNNVNFIHIDKSTDFASSSLCQYFIEKQDKNYDIINRFITDNNFEKMKDFETTKIYIPENKDKNKKDKESTFLQLIEKDNEEQIYTNMLYYWLSKNNLLNNFINRFAKKIKNQNDKFEIKKENSFSDKNGRADLVCYGKSNNIVIENKILSGINGKEKDLNKNKKTQLSKYINAVKEADKLVQGLLLVPDYMVYNLLNEIYKLDEEDTFKKYYKLVKYSELKNFFESERKNISNDPNYGYYDEFLRDLSLQSVETIDEKNKEEMTQKFLNAINNVKNIDKVE